MVGAKDPICAFCGRDYTEVLMLVAGDREPAVHICDRCVGQVWETMYAFHRREQAKRKFRPQTDRGIIVSAAKGERLQ